MSLIDSIKSWWEHHKADQVRTIPDSYFRGVRRLAESVEETEQPWLNKCSTCRHAIGHRSWHCDRLREGCKWERCYVKTELSNADYKAGIKFSPYESWIRLPRKEDTK